MTNRISTRRLPRGHAPAAAGLANHGALVFVVGVLILTTIIRLHLAGMPLERDEGEYAYAGRLILQGTPPYLQAYNMKFPGIYYAYSAILALFGQSARGVHIGLLVVNLATILLVFAIARRLAGDLSASVAAATFALLSVGASVLGAAAHATHFVLLPALGGLLILLRTMDSGRKAPLLASGALLGIAILMKQHAVFFLPLAAALILWSGRRNEPRGLRSLAARLGALSVGVALPLLLVCLVLLGQGVLARFWFWTFQYAWEYVNEIPLTQAFPMFLLGLKRATASNWLLWMLGGVGLLALWLGRREGIERVFVTGLLAASLLATAPGLYFREHYFILLLPATALLAGTAVGWLGRMLQEHAPSVSRWVPAALFTVIAGLSILPQRDYLFTMDARTTSRMIYGGNPFPESVEIARYIRERSGPDASIAVLGSEPQIYFYAQRPSATGFIYTYPLMEPQRYATRMQEDMIREIEAAHPTYLVFARFNLSWLVRRESDRRILEWAERYVGRCYDTVGIADILPEKDTKFLWDEQVEGYVPASSHVVFVFRRKSDAPCVASEGR